MFLIVFLYVIFVIILSFRFFVICVLLSSCAVSVVGLTAFVPAH